MGIHREGAALLWMALLLLGGHSTSSPAADEARIVELGHAYPGYHNAGRSGIAVADIDGDGRADFVYTATAGPYVAAGTASSSLLFVVGRRADGSIGLKQSLRVPTAGFARVLAAPAGGDERVYTVATDGTVTAYGHWPLQVLRTFPTRGGATTALIGDINADGHDELVVAADGYLQAHVLSTGQPLWQTHIGASVSSIALAQLDADPALEIVIGGYDGYVVDGATGAIQGARADGFGGWVATGLLDNASDGQVVGTYDSIRVFDRAAPWPVSWTFDPGYARSVTLLKATDLDGDGRDEILFGERFGVALRVIDGATRIERDALPSTYSGCRSIGGAADVLGDGGKGVAFVTDGGHSGLTAHTGAFELIDVRSRSSRLLIGEVPRRYGAVAFGDVDGDGRVEQVIGAWSGSDVGAVHVVDPHSGQLKWASSDSAPARLDLSVNAVAVGRFGAGLASDIVLAGSNTYDGSISVIDGVSHQVRLRIYEYARGPLKNRPVDAVALFDHDRDGVPDIVAATRTGTGAKLHVFSGASGALLGESADVVGVQWEKVRGVLVVDDGSTGVAPELILALANSIRAFDARTLQPTWMMLANSAGTRHVAKGAAGAELLSFNGNGGISFYSARTRAFLRSIPTPGPTTAVIALEEDVRQLVVAAAGRLHLIDGISGSVRAVSGDLGSALAQDNQLAAVEVGRGVWQIASGGDAGYYRHRVELTEQVFSDGFEVTTP